MYAVASLYANLSPLMTAEELCVARPGINCRITGTDGEPGGGGGEGNPGGNLGRGDETRAAAALWLFVYVTFHVIVKVQKQFMYFFFCRQFHRFLVRLDIGFFKTYKKSPDCLESSRPRGQCSAPLGTTSIILGCIFQPYL